MKTLYVKDFTLPGPSDAFRTSPAYQLFSSDRAQVREATLVGILDAGWAFDTNEVSPASLGQRSLLLQYLGTLDSRLRVPGTQGFDSSVSLTSLAEVAHSTGEALQRREQNGPTTFLDSTLLRQHDAEQVALRLLDLGADPWVRDGEGRDVLDQAVALGWPTLVDRLLNDPRAPVAAALDQRVLWIEHLTNPRATPGNRLGQGIGLPWLHAMAAFGHLPLLGRLLQHGLAVNHGDAFGRTPLFYAPFASTANWLIEAGVDLLAMDERHQTASQAWPQMVNSLAEKTALQAVVKAALEHRMADDPEKLKAQQTSTLFTAAVNDPKAAVVKFMRENGLTVNARRPNDAPSDPGMTLLAHTARHAIGDSKRSRAFLSHVLERCEDPWHESVPGIPDAWLALLASVERLATGGADFPGRAWQVMHQQYGLDDDEGLGRFLDDGLRLMRGWAVPGTREAWAIPLTGLAGVQLWAGLMNALLERTPAEERLGSPLQAALAQTEGRRAKAWAWVDALAQVMHDQDITDTVFRMTRLVGQLAGRTLPSEGVNAEGRPQGAMVALLPTTPDTVHALLPLMVLAPKNNAMTLHGLRGAPEPWRDWTAPTTNQEVFRVMKQAMDDGVDVDSRAPHFAERLARLQKHQPFFAHQVEQQVLRGAARLGDDLPSLAVNARRRL